MQNIDRRSAMLRPEVLFVLALVTPSLMGCEVIEGIFKAGVWVGIVAVAVVLALAFGVTRIFSRGS
jgi:hypothetical protein